METTSSKYDFCYVLTHGFAVRFILQTGLIKKLTQCGYTVAVIMPDAKSVNAELLKRRDKADIFEYNMPPGNKERFMKSFRKYIVEDITENPALYDKHRQMVNVSNRKLSGFFGILLSKTAKFLPFIRRIYSFFEKKLLYKKQIEEYINKINPKVLVCTYPVAYPEPQFLFAAERLKILTIIHLLSWDNITAKGSFPALSDKYIVWGEIMKKELMDYYKIIPNNISICGVPHFDVHFETVKKLTAEKAKEKLNIPPVNKVIFFAMSAVYFAPREVEIIENLVSIAHNISNKYPKNGKFTIIVRPHPAMLKGDFKDSSIIQKLEKLSKNGKIILNLPNLNMGDKTNWSIDNSDMDVLATIMRATDLLLNSGSTISIEALIYKCSVGITAFDGSADLPYWKSARRLSDYTHLKKFFNLNSVVILKSFSDLTGMLEDSIQNNISINNHEEIYRQEAGIFDGNATHRVFLALKNSISDNKKS